MKALVALLVTVVGIGMVIFSDVYLRAGGRDGVAGLDARSYDITGSLAFYVGLALVVQICWRRRGDS